MKYLVLLLPLLLLSREVTVEQLFNVQTVKVKRITTVKTQKNYGYVVADESRIYDVVPRFGGNAAKKNALLQISLNHTMKTCQTRFLALQKQF